MDQSIETVVNLGVFKMVLNQATFIALFDILVNNVGFLDQYSKEFKQRLVVQANVIVQEEARKTEIKRKAERKSLDLKVNARCLALEMRDFDHKLICEVCIVSFIYVQRNYLNGKSYMQLQAGTMFMFHDENIVSGSKEVMMGHLHARSEVYTDQDDFYESIPEAFEEDMQEN